MRRFGCRSSFGVEVGDIVDVSGHIPLDFYLRGLHLNRADNQGYFSAVAHYFPTCAGEKDYLAAMARSLDVFSGKSVESILMTLLEAPESYLRCSRFKLGPVTDSFDLLVLPASGDVVLIGLRNDGFHDDDEDLSGWKVAYVPGGDPVHWQTVTLPMNDYTGIIDEVERAMVRISETTKG